MPTSVKNNNIYYLKAIVCMLIMFCFGYLPPVEPITPLGMHIVGIFFGLLFGWMTIGLIWPSIMGCIALVLVGGMKIGAVLSSGWGSTVNLFYGDGSWHRGTIRSEPFYCNVFYYAQVGFRKTMGVYFCVFNDGIFVSCSDQYHSYDYYLLVYLVQHL